MIGAATGIGIAVVGLVVGFVVGVRQERRRTMGERFRDVLRG